MFEIGSWKPGNFPPVVTLITKLILFGLMVVRGADYLFGDEPSTSVRLSTIEAAAPIHWWGAACLIAGAIGFSGITLRRANLVLWGHVIGAAIYMSFSISAAISVIRLSENPDRGLIPFLILSSIAVGFLYFSRKGHRGSQDKIVAAALLITIGVAITTLGLDGLRTATIFAGVAGINIMMAIGTAARQRQMSILEARSCE